MFFLLFGMLSTLRRSLTSFMILFLSDRSLIFLLDQVKQKKVDRRLMQQMLFTRQKEK